MSTIGTKFRKWVLTQRVNGVVPTAIDANHMRVKMMTVTAEVNIYPGLDGNEEIAEYRIVRHLDNEAIFFLHVLLDDLERAKELFEEMVEALESENEQQATHVLLCCTSALTTTLFASKMGDVAIALSLDYDFTAMPVSEALQPGGNWAAVLLAPQVSHMRQKLMEAHPDAVVFEIPGKVFGSFDAAAALQLVMHALHDVQATDERHNNLRSARDLANDRRILIITLFTLRDYSRLGYRVFDHGTIESEGAVRKPRLDFRDIEDLIETLPGRGVTIDNLDAVGIAVPGVAYRGTVTLEGIVEGTHDLRGHIEGRFGIKTYVDNNCNAAAVGCYVSQDKYENLVFFRHAFGHAAGGLGTIIDGRLLKGRGNLAGEPRYYESLLKLDSPYDDALWTEEGLFQIAKNVATVSIALTAPEAIYLGVDTVDDMDKMHDALCEIFPPEHVPPLYVVDDYIERVYLGEMAICLQKLHDPTYHSLGIA
ncbi:MAG: ROK family protein [Atopobiaceae bacterium]|nr:ROK family protein [Atopobiaceae bacterium]